MHQLMQRRWDAPFQKKKEELQRTEIGSSKIIVASFSKESRMHQLMQRR
jgi:hypothetical protein